MAQQATRPIPEGYHTITPALTLRGGMRALEWYAKAFGARERFRMPGPDGGLMHAEMTIGDSIFMLADESPQMPGGRSPQGLGGTPVGFYLYVEDADAVFQRAVGAGATATTPMADMFWGDRCGTVQDPFGHQWTIATHREDLSPEEMAERARRAFEQTGR